MRVGDGGKVMIEELSLEVMYTPGHTDNSYSYLMADRVFTGDTLLIRGTGRTDFQNGSARAQYDRSLAGCSSFRTRRWCFRRMTTRAILSPPSRGETLQSAAAGSLGG